MSYVYHGDFDVNGITISKEFLDELSKFSVFGVDDGISIDPTYSHIYLEEFVDKSSKAERFDDDLLSASNYLTKDGLSYMFFSQVVPRNDIIRNTIMTYGLEGDAFILRGYNAELDKEFIDDLSIKLVDYGVSGSLYPLLGDKEYLERLDDYDRQTCEENIIEEIMLEVDDYLIGEYNIVTVVDDKYKKDLSNLFHYHVKDRLFQMKHLVELVKF